MLAAALLLAATVDLRLELVRHSLTGTHCRYREYVDGIPSERYVVRPCDGMPTPEGSSASAERGGLRNVDGRVVRREIVEESPLHPYAHDYDAATGELVARTPLYFQAKPARVFDPNPVAAQNDPSLQDGNDSARAVPESAYRVVMLDDVAESGPLRGPWLAIVDKQLPAIAPIDASASFLLDRGADGFEDVNAYFHLDRNQRYLQSLGYTGVRAIAPYAVEVDAHAQSGADNSLFIPSATVFGTGTLYFGEGGTDDAEDADLVIHEYGHALLEWIAPGTFGGTFAAQSRALGEGFGDYWAYSAHAAQRIASGRDPFCFAEWDARCWKDASSERCAYSPGSDCLRRLDSPKTMADYVDIEAPGVEHRNGAIWSSALRELQQTLGREVTDTIVLESLFDVPPKPTFAVLARRMLSADRLLYNGAHAAAICAPMIARGILDTCEELPRGELTLFPSPQRGVAIPDNSAMGITAAIAIEDRRAIENLYVRVDVAHPTRGDLRIDLVAPDGTTVILQQISFDRGPDVRTTFGLTAAPVESLHVLRGRSAAGTWRLVVRDQRTRDTGTLLSWGLMIQFAGDVPRTTRPRGPKTQMIPVVAHVYGIGPSPYVSDVRIANVRAVRETATLIFTRSGEDGTTRFSAIDVALAPGQTVGFDDVVASAFGTSGSGTLEILGDVIAMSRTYTDGRGQQVPPNLPSTAVGESALVLNPLLPSGARLNLGIAEVAGGSGIVDVRGQRIAILPFSHVQFPVTSDVAAVSVVSGDARVVAYLSQVDGATGDAMFLPGEPFSAERRTLLAPAINVNGWRSDLWARGADALLRLSLTDGASRDVSVGVYEDVLAQLFEHTIAALLVTVPPGVVAATRITHDGTTQVVPLLEPAGPAEQHLLFMESTDALRTNIGFVSDGPARAEVTIYDASGLVVGASILDAKRGIDQFAFLPRLVNGRARVRFEAGHGRAYASVIDQRSGDATYVVGQ